MTDIWGHLLGLRNVEFARRTNHGHKCGQPMEIDNLLLFAYP